MAWYYGTFSCGHEGRVNITGPTKNRQYLADRKFTGMCEDCWEEHLQAERERKNKEAEEKAMEMELPELEGTEKQIAWANTLRQKLIDKFDSILEQTGKRIFLKTHLEEDYERKVEELQKIERLLQGAIEKDIQQKIERYENKIENIKESICELEKERVKKEDIVLILNYILNNFRSSEFFIDNRQKEVHELVGKYKKEALKTDEEKLIEKHEKDLEEELKKEATVYPENRITDAVVILEKDGDILKAIFEKNEKFREIVKFHCLSWKGNCWRRYIGFKNGKIEDRMAELGNALLAEGFPIRIMDKNIREMAINRTFELEQYNWVDCIEKGILIIQWLGYSKKLYEIAKKLPGARWNNNLGVFNIKTEHIQEVEEFARLYNFKFTDRALKEIEIYRDNLKDIKIVSTEKVEKEEQKDGLKEILNSSLDVLEDLKDED
ncbi:hypothetical protein [Clostridium botulinum]|uniref:hypothetical protein n=1 Tax=Clostridium botulinum TaxID=1491 RepID=UPI0004D471AE|nr:hypothetical protein [Clostridium botulinum]KEH96196.1 hypothetical protein Z953_p0264 [Clostridium botulinum D str. 16868]